MERQGDARGGAMLETERLRLRPFLPRDLNALHALFIHPEVRRFLWDDQVVSRDTVQALIAASLASFSVRDFGHWVAEDRRTQVLVGVCGLRPTDDTREIELLYALAPERWGEGLATEAGEAVLTHAFQRAGLPRVVARTDSPNLASVRVLERLGMQFEGERVVNGLPMLHYAISDAAFRERAAALADLQSRK